MTVSVYATLVMLLNLIGDMPLDFYPSLAWDCVVQEHAVDMIARLCWENPDEVTVLFMPATVR